MSSSQNLSFKRALIIAGIFHFVLFAALLVRFSFSSKDKSQLVINPDHTPVQATLIHDKDMKAEAKRIADLERQKFEEKQAAERALEREKQKLAEERRQTELKKQQVIAEQKRQEDAKKKAVEAEKQKKLADDKAAKQKAADLAKKAAADKAATELATKQAEQNKQAAAKLDADNATKSAANQVEALAEIERYKAMVRQQIMRYWVVQKGLNQQEATKLFVRVAPTGTVLDVKVTGSSGSDALDRSAVAAVYKASPLPVPKDPELFREFRELRLTLRPDSILSDN